MPTSPGIGSRSPTVSRAATGGGGGANPSSSIVAMLAEQQQGQMQKLMKAMEDMEKRNAEAIEAASQAGAGAATQVANQVAQGMDKANQQKDRTREREEDKDFQIDMAEMQKQWAQDAMKEAQRLGIALNGQKEAMLRFRTKWYNQKADHQDAMAAFEARTITMTANGRFNSKEGREKLRWRQHHLKMQRVLGDGHFDDRHLEEAFRLHDDSLQAIAAGEDGMDLRQLTIDPMDKPFGRRTGNPDNRGRRLIQPGEITPEREWELQIADGYPPEGVFAEHPSGGKHGMPEGYEPNLFTGDTFLEAMAERDSLDALMDESMKGELKQKTTALLVKAYDSLEPMIKVWKNFNEEYLRQAPRAVEKAFDEFLADPDPDKWRDSGRYIWMKSVKHISGGGEAGERMATTCMQVFDGEKEFMSQGELPMSMGCESMAYNIADTLERELSGLTVAATPGEDGAVATGAGAANRMLSAMKEEMSDDEIAAVLNVPAGAVGTVSLLETLQGTVGEWTAFAGTAKAGFREQGLLVEFKKKYGSVVRKIDQNIFEHQMTDDGKEARLERLVPQGDIDAANNKRIDAMSPGDVRSDLENFDEGDEGVDTSFEELNVSAGKLSWLAAFAGELGHNTIKNFGLWASDTFPDAPSISEYRKIVKEEKRNDPFSNAFGNRTGAFNNKRARGLLGSETPSVPLPQTMKEKGAVGVMFRAPELVTPIIRGTSQNLQSIAVGNVQNIFGEDTARKTAQGARMLGEGSQPLMTPDERNTIRDSDLTDSEKHQVIRSSNPRILDQSVPRRKLPD